LFSQEKDHASAPNSVGSWFTPPRGLSSQRQIVPVTAKDSAIGNKKTVRKTLSPLMF